jgi:exonuclease SbcD
MKLLHTSDWHLGKRLGDFMRLPEQHKVMAEICEIAEAQHVDAIIVAGDIFDTFNPPVEAVELFYKTVKRLSANGTKPVIVIAGNHDSPERIEAPDPLARECGIIMTGNPLTQVPAFKLTTGIEVIDSKPGLTIIKFPQFPYSLRVLHTPYANELRLKTYLGISNPDQSLRDVLAETWAQACNSDTGEQMVSILVTHLYMVQANGPRPEEPIDEEKPIVLPGGLSEVFTSSIPQAIHYVALGHLHRRQIIANEPCPVVYAGSPLAYSFSEAFQDKYVEIVELEPNRPAIHQSLKLTSGFKLLRKRFQTPEEAIEWLPQNPDCLLELTLCTSTYLSPELVKHLNSLHAGIVSIIPEITGNATFQNPSMAMPDLSKDFIALFSDYFKSRKQTPPDEETLSLLKEIMAWEDSE